jgi:hypothetical protein
MKRGRGEWPTGVEGDHGGAAIADIMEFTGVARTHATVHYYQIWKNWDGEGAMANSFMPSARQGKARVGIAVADGGEKLTGILVRAL